MQIIKQICMLEASLPKVIQKLSKEFGMKWRRDDQEIFKWRKYFIHTGQLKGEPSRSVLNKYLKLK